MNTLMSLVLVHRMFLTLIILNIFPWHSNINMFKKRKSLFQNKKQKMFSYKCPAMRQKVIKQHFHSNDKIQNYIVKIVVYFLFIFCKKNLQFSIDDM